MLYLLRYRVILFVLGFLIYNTSSYGQTPRLVVPIGHTGPIKMAAFSPDGKTIATASSDKTVKLWDAFTGILLADLTWKDTSGIGGIYAMDVFFSPDGSVLLVSDGSNITIWNAMTGKLLATTEGTCAALSPDGKSFVYGAYNLQVHDLSDFHGKTSIEGHDSLVNTVSYSPDGKKVITGSEDGIARIWNSKTGKLLTSLLPHDGPVYTAQFSPGGTRVLTTCDDSIARLWEASTGKLLANLRHRKWVTNACFSPDGSVIVTISEDSIAKAWSTATGTHLFDMPHSGEINHAAVFPDGKSIVTVSDDSTLKIWDIITGQLKPIIEEHQKIDWVSFSADGLKMITGLHNGTAVVRDVQSMSALVTLRGYDVALNKAFFIMDGKKILTHADNGVLKMWDTEKPAAPVAFNIARATQGIFASPDGNKLALQQGDSTIIWNVQTDRPLATVPGKFGGFRRNGSMMVTVYVDKAMVWDAWTGNMIKQIAAHKDKVIDAAISPDGKKLLTGSTDYTAKIWDIETGNLQAVMQHPIFVRKVEFAPSGNRVLTVVYGGSAYLWDTAGKQISVLEHGLIVSEAIFSPDGRRIATTSNDDNTIRLWDARTGQLMLQFVGHTNGIKGAAFSGDGKNLISISSDNTVNTWNARNGRLLYSFACLAKDEYLFRIPSGYYMSSPGAARLLHYVTPALKVITFDQLDVKYNRPDKVLGAINSPDTLLIASYRKAYEKRIKKLGIDTATFSAGYSVPEADFSNRASVAFIQTHNKLVLKFKSIDKAFRLVRFNIWINEVPLFGLRGKTISKATNSFDTLLTVILSNGDNRIEASVVNENGAESYRMPLFVKYIPVIPPQEKLYFIGIGINRFADTSNNLNWSVKDIRDIALKLKQRYPSIIIDTLFDEHVTKENILSLKKKLQELYEDDKVIISYSGHGILSKDLDYYLSTYPINFDHPEAEGLSYEALESLLDSIRPRKKLMFIDACHSGEIDKEEIARITSSGGSLDSMGIKRKSTIRITANSLGMANSFELMQNIFANVGRGTGATIISAAGGMQYAQERGDLKNGVFTFSMIDAFNRNATLTVSRLKKIVSDNVTLLTNGLQKPTSRNETNSYDWIVW